MKYLFLILFFPFILFSDDSAPDTSGYDGSFTMSDVVDNDCIMKEFEKVNDRYAVPKNNQQPDEISKTYSSLNDNGFTCYDGGYLKDSVAYYSEDITKYVKVDEDDDNIYYDVYSQSINYNYCKDRILEEFDNENNLIVYMFLETKDITDYSEECSNNSFLFQNSDNSNIINFNRSCYKGVFCVIPKDECIYDVFTEDDLKKCGCKLPKYKGQDSCLSCSEDTVINSTSDGCIPKCSDGQYPDIDGNCQSPCSDDYHYYYPIWDNYDSLPVISGDNGVDHYCYKEAITTNDGSNDNDANSTSDDTNSSSDSSTSSTDDNSDNSSSDDSSTDDNNDNSSDDSSTSSTDDNSSSSATSDNNESNDSSADINNTLSDGSQGDVAGDDDSDDTSLDFKTDDIENFITNLKNSYNGIVDNITNIRNIFNQDFTNKKFNTASYDNSCTSFSLFGRQISLDICPIFSKFSSLFYFITKIVMLVLSIRIFIYSISLFTIGGSY